MNYETEITLTQNKIGRDCQKGVNRVQTFLAKDTVKYCYMEQSNKALSRI